MTDIDKMIKEINDQLVSFNKYEPKNTVSIEGKKDILSKFSLTKEKLCKKKNFPYFLIPLIITIFLVYSKPNFLYEETSKENEVKKLNKKKTLNTVLILSVLGMGLYYFYIEKLFT